MKTLFRKLSTRCAVTDACRITLCFIALTAAPLAIARSPDDPASIGPEHPTEHNTDHEGMTWPPQPEGIRNPRVLSNVAIEKSERDAKLRHRKEVEQVVNANPDARETLGARFTRPTIVEDKDKKTSQRRTRVVYFSHSKNSTVEVDMEGGNIVGVKTQPADQYQPEITDEEIAEAAAIARAYFKSQGQNRVDDLQAFGILAYTPNGKFYDTRVIYISFHPSSDKKPEFEAWVDLTNQRVIRAREEQL